MNRLIYAVSLCFLITACADFNNPDAGQPEVERTTARTPAEVVACLSAKAKEHDTPVKLLPLPQGTTLDFGGSNIVKVRSDNGQTYYRFYPGQRHVSTLWIDAASATCAP